MDIGLDDPVSSRLPNFYSVSLLVFIRMLFSYGVERATQVPVYFLENMCQNIPHWTFGSSDHYLEVIGSRDPLRAN